MKNSSLGARLLSSSAVIFAIAGVCPAIAQTTGGLSPETVVVTGTREEAQEIKKDAPNVEDVQSLDSIRALPDVNAAEALERIPGVSLESDSGEGRFVNIRGMDADLNGTTYDGVRMTASNASSPQGGGRAVAFDAFPSGILGGIEVMKSLTPEMDAEGLGGVVNILPRTIPTDKSSFVDGSLGTGLEPLRGTPVYQGDVTAGTRFGDGDRMSVIGSFAYHDDQRGIDDIEEDYLNDPSLPPTTFDDVQYRWYKYHRTRVGYGGGFAYAPDDDTNLYLRGIHAGYTEYGYKHRLEIDGLGDDVLSTGSNGDITVDSGSAIQNLTISKETIGNDLIEAGGNTVLGDLKLDGKVSWTRGSDDVPYSYGYTFSDPNDLTLVYNNSNPAYPVYKTLDGSDLTNASSYDGTFKGKNGPGKNSDEEWAGRLDASLPLGFTDNDEFKFGVSVRERKRLASASAASIKINSDSYAAFASAMDDIYYDDHYNIGPKPNWSMLKAIDMPPPMDDPTAFEDDNENVFAGYVQYTGHFGALDVQGGLRVEATQGTYRANAFDGNGNLLGLDTAKHNYTDFFPDVNLKYNISDDMLVRAAFSTAIARPGFNQITAAKTIDYDADIVSEGNPDLKPTTGRSYDLSAEYYSPDGGIATIGLFYKEFTDYIIPTVQMDVANYPDPLLTGLNVEIDSFQNIGSAHADGVEFNYRQPFNFLPDPLDGMGFEGNLTLVGSSGEIRSGEKHTLPQTSPINYNASLFYEKGPFDLRIAASFVSRNLWAVGSNAGGDLYSQPRFRLDFGGSYAVTDAITYYLDVKDITDTKLEFTQTASRAFPVQREFYGPTFLTGLRIRLD